LLVLEIEPGVVVHVTNRDECFMRIATRTASSASRSGRSSSSTAVSGSSTAPRQWGTG
jgi:hypothetical protein